MMKTVESVVKSRYAAGAQASETSLCCPVEYDEDLLRVLPREVVSAGALHEAVEKAIIDVPLADAKPFDCSRTSLRHPKETKGQDYDVTTKANNTAAMGAVAADFPK